MSGRRLFYTAAALVMVLLATAFLAAGCGAGDDKIKEARQQGYEEGVKAEQAKWSNEKLKLAQTYIKEQEDSQETIMHLLQGDITGITIGAIAIDEAAGTAKVDITAHVSDGSSFNGVIDMVRIDSYWYIQKVTHTTQPTF